MKTIKFLSILLCAGPALSLRAQIPPQIPTVPPLINYQGALVDAGGAALPDGDYSLRFEIYTDANAGTNVWGPQAFDGEPGTGHAAKVPVVGGRFNVVLGPVDTDSRQIVDALNGTNRYLQLVVGGTTNIVPRQQILSAPFALRADAADGLSLAGYSAVFGNTNVGGAFIPGGRIQAASITSLQISYGAVSNAQIAAAAVSGDKLTIPLSLFGNYPLAVLQVTNTGGPGIATVGGSHGVYGIGSYNGVYGVSSSPGLGVGVRGEGQNGAIGVWAEGATAGEFWGNVNVHGAITKSGGSFKIDHPLDPANKYLYHSFVESPDMKNIYDGVATLDGKGEAVVSLPAWFEALNKDFRYQLTAIGAPGPNLHIAQELANNRFRIGGGTQGMKVSWQITGIRHDAWAVAHPVAVEQSKSAGEKGTYLSPAEHGQPQTKGLLWHLRHSKAPDHK